MNTKRPLVSYVLPAFNEAGIIESNLAELYGYLSRLHEGESFELVVVNDGSSDETGILADAFAAAHHGVSVHHHVTNQGLNAALKSGFLRARGDAVVTLDIDLSYAPYHIALMLQALAETGAAIVLASPYARGGQVVNVPWSRKTLSAWANHYLSLAAAGKVRTLTCMVRAYNASPVRDLIQRANVELDSTVVFEALRNQMCVVEVPSRLEWRRNEAGAARRSSMKVFAHCLSVLKTGINYRPSILLALPGLIPGLFPLVIAVLLILRASRTMVVDWTAATITLQILSMMFAGVLAGTYVHKVRSLSRHRTLAGDTRTEFHA